MQPNARTLKRLRIYFVDLYVQIYEKRQTVGGLPLNFLLGRRLPAVLVGDAELLAGVATAGAENAAAVSAGHTGAETVLVHALALGGLKCPFHNISFLFISHKGLQR